MKTYVLVLAATVITSTPAVVQPAIAQNQQSEADKGVKTRNSGESGYVGEQEKQGAAATPPGRPDAASSTAASGATSAQSSGTGISGAPGSKNGPAAGQNTVGSDNHNQSVQQQDPSNVQGLPGNKSGPPAKR
ncbi:hypothetical protein IC762_29830 [Bradyrhizobium genosp. L]|uniref:hypothetical protein n=1 Tax=Bradyrhizobium genosp. L TaxID=83637 RepID=UPI0018A32DC5|nr:hypothetical protein IC762_29830 [Bradyrhizobium genosp. L]